MAVKDIVDTLGKEEEDTSQESQESKEKSKDSKLNIDDKAIRELLAMDNSKGIYAPTKFTDKKIGEDEPKFETISETAKVTTGEVKLKGKYQKAFVDDMKKHPEKYFINTSRGRLSIKDALQQGYNPKTKRFEKGYNDMMQEEMDKLNPNDQEGVKNFLDPSKLNLAEADANAMGIDSGNPMIKSALQEQLGQLKPQGLGQAQAMANPTAPSLEQVANSPLTKTMGGNR